MAEKVVCNKCGTVYTDKESIELVRKWIADGYAPCPNLGCPGQLEVRKINALCQPVKVKGSSLDIDTKSMKIGVYYPVEFQGMKLLYKRTGDTTVEVYQELID